MKTSIRWNFRNVVGKVLMGLALAAMIGSIDVLPASAKDKNDRWEGRHDNGRHEGKRGRGYYENDYRGRRVYRSYGYRERVYVEPPPVIYAPPPPPPGISVFFPPLIFR